MYEPRVFYGPTKEGREPEMPLPNSRTQGSGSEAETEVEEPRARNFKRLHRRYDSTDTTDLSLPVPRKKMRHVAKARISTRDGRDVNGRRQLQRACDRGDIEKVKQLIANGEDVNDRDYAGTAVLHSAALNGSVEIVKVLLDNGAIVDIRSGPDELDTPLMDAASHGWVDVVTLLLERGADPRVTNAAGETALDFVDDSPAETQESSAALVTLFQEALAEARKSKRSIDANADPRTFPNAMKHESSDDSGESQDENRGSGMAGTAGRGRRRHNNSSWPDLTTKAGRQEVTKRAGLGDMEFIGMALEQGWAPSAEALVLAAKHGHTDVVGLLLAYGLKPDSSHDGVTALCATLGRGHPSTVKLLLDSGANPRLQNKAGKSYIDLLDESQADEEERNLVKSFIKDAPQSSKRAALVADKNGSKESGSDVTGPTVKPKAEPVPDSASDPDHRPVLGPASETVLEHASEGPQRPAPEFVSKPVMKKPRPVEQESLYFGPIFTDEQPELPKQGDTDRKESTERPSRSHPGEQSTRFTTPIESDEVAVTDSPEPQSVQPRPRLGNGYLKSARHTSPTPSPLSSPHAQNGEGQGVLTAGERAELAAKMENLVAKRERERKQREAQMLQALEAEEKRRAERKSVSKQLEPEPSGIARDTKLSSAEATPDATPKPGSPVAIARETSRSLSVAEIEAALSAFPFAVRKLAYLGEPQPNVQPLLARRRSEKVSDFEQSSRDYQLMDVQVALFLGRAQFNEQHPTMEREQITVETKHSIWSLVQPWLCKPGSDPAAISEDLERFLAMPVYWLRGDQVMEAVGQGVRMRTVPIAPSSTPRRPKKQAHAVTRRLPLRFATKLHTCQRLSRWTNGP